MDALPTSLVGLALLGIGIEVARRWRRHRQQRGGFLDIVQHPERLRFYEQRFRDRERLVAAARRWQPAEIVAAVQAFLFGVKSSDDARWMPEALEMHVASTEAAVLTILRDGAQHERLVAPTGKSILPEAPFHRACQLLSAPSPAVIPVLAPFLHAADSSIRKEAAHVLGATGDAAAIPCLRRTLADADEYVRSYAIMGLQRASARGCLAPACATDLFADVAAQLAEWNVGHEALALLIEFGRERAVRWLIDHELRPSDTHRLAWLIEGMQEGDALLPRPLVQAWLAELEPSTKPEPARAKGALLAMLGSHGCREDEALLRSHLPGPPSTALGAARGLLALAGLASWRDRVFERWHALGLAVLPLAAQHVCAVHGLDGQICNGGLTQYFFNSAGNHLPIAKAGLLAIGARGLADVLQTAADRFGRSGPSTERTERQAQLAEVMRGKEDLFQDLDHRWYDGHESLQVELLLYVLANSNAFR